MKEIEFKTIQALITKELDTLNIKYIAVFFAINLIVVFINWIIQKNVKKLDNSIYRQKVREDRRITILENLYKEFVSFTYVLNKDDIKLEIDRISQLERTISENRLYINNQMNKSIIKYLDYLKKIISDFRHKDFVLEKKLLKEIELEFNK